MNIKAECFKLTHPFDWLFILSNRTVSAASRRCCIRGCHCLKQSVSDASTGLQKAGRLCLALTEFLDCISIYRISALPPIVSISLGIRSIIPRLTSDSKIIGLKRNDSKEKVSGVSLAAWNLQVAAERNRLEDRRDEWFVVLGKCPVSVIGSHLESCYTSVIELHDVL
jgi:hypothetical protein